MVSKMVIELFCIELAVTLVRAIGNFHVRKVHNKILSSSWVADKISLITSIFLVEIDI